MNNNSQATAASKAPAEDSLKMATTGMLSNEKLHETGNGGDKVRTC